MNEQAGQVRINPDNTLSFTPSTNFNGQAEIQYRISDQQGGTATGRVDLVVNPVNDSPAPMNDSFTMHEDTVATINVLTNDHDVDGDDLAVSGAIVLGGMGQVSYNDGELVFRPQTTRIWRVSLLKHQPQILWKPFANSTETL